MEVLIGEESVLFNEFFEDIVAHTALPLRRTNAGVFERLGYALGDDAIDEGTAGGFVAELLTLEQSG